MSGLERAQGFLEAEESSFSEFQKMYRFRKSIDSGKLNSQRIFKLR